MNKHRLIKKILGTFLIQNGFSDSRFGKGEFGGGDWIFDRKVDQIKQTIFVSDRPGHGLSLTLDTNGFGQERVHLGDLDLPKEFALNLLDCLDYETEEDLIGILEMFRDLIGTYGFAELEKRSFHTSEARVKEETDGLLCLRIWENRHSFWRCWGLI